MSPEALLRTVPFAHNAGLEVLSAGPEGVRVRIPNSPGNQNHVGTVHAAALVLVGETAGGLALLNEPRLSGYLLLAKGLTIRYRKPGVAAVTASAGITGQQVEQAIAAVESIGKVDVPLVITLHGEAGEVVAEMTVDYHLRKRTV